MKVTRVVIVLLSMIAVTGVHAQSFDCNRATTEVENAICSSPELRMRDRDMARLYTKALSTRPGDREIASSQRAWLKERDACAIGSRSRVELNECLSEAYDARKNYLEAASRGRLDICNAIALRDVAAVEAPDSVLSRGSYDEAVTQYVINKQTGMTSFCSHGGYCYPTHVHMDGRRQEALRLLNCKVRGKIFEDAEQIIYAVAAGGP